MGESVRRRETLKSVSQTDQEFILSQSDWNGLSNPSNPDKTGFIRIRRSYGNQAQKQTGSTHLLGLAVSKHKEQHEQLAMERRDPDRVIFHQKSELAMRDGSRAHSLS